MSLNKSTGLLTGGNILRSRIGEKIRFAFWWSERIEKEKRYLIFNIIIIFF